MPSEPPHENWKVTDEWSYYLTISNFEDTIRLHAQQFWKFVSIRLGILLSKTDSVQPAGKYNTQCRIVIKVFEISI